MRTSHSLLNRVALAAFSIAILHGGARCTSAQDLEQAVKVIGQDLRAAAEANGVKALASLDFTDVQGAGSALGKLLAEELTSELVVGQKAFSVVDRANLTRIMEEHKLSMSGLIKLEETKKLGEIAGVDAIVLGTYTAFGSEVRLNAKLIATETAKILGASRGKLKKSEEVVELIETVPTSGGVQNSPSSPKPQTHTALVAQDFDFVRLEIRSIRFNKVGNSSEGLTSFTIKNLLKKNDIQLALNTIMDTKSPYYHAPSGPRYGVTRSGTTVLLPNRVGANQSAEPITCAILVDKIGTKFYFDGILGLNVAEEGEPGTLVGAGKEISFDLRFKPSSSTRGPTTPLKLQVEFLARWTDEKGRTQSKVVKAFFPSVPY